MFSQRSISKLSLVLTIFILIVSILITSARRPKSPCADRAKDDIEECVDDYDDDMRKVSEM